MSEPSGPLGTAFKEWAGVCAALAEGRQTLILRKGGIAEGPGGFSPEHPRFWLYPTHVHEGEQGLKPEARLGEGPPAGRVRIDTLAEVDTIVRVDRLDRLEQIEDEHVWTPETITKRFHYREPGLWLLLVRIFRRDEPYELTVTAEHAGCRTWVPLDPPLPLEGVRPVLDGEDFRLRLDRILDRIRPT